MHEDIIPAFKTDEPESFAIVEPFNRTFCLHRNAPFLNGHDSYMAGPGTQLAVTRLVM